MHLEENLSLDYSTRVARVALAVLLTIAVGLCLLGILFGPVILAVTVALLRMIREEMPGHELV